MLRMQQIIVLSIMSRAPTCPLAHSDRILFHVAAVPGQYKNQGKITVKDLILTVHCVIWHSHDVDSAAGRGEYESESGRKLSVMGCSCTSVYVKAYEAEKLHPF